MCLPILMISCLLRDGWVNTWGIRTHCKMTKFNVLRLRVQTHVSARFNDNYVYCMMRRGKHMGLPLRIVKWRNVMFYVVGCSPMCLPVLMIYIVVYVDNCL